MAPAAGKPACKSASTPCCNSASTEKAQIAALAKEEADLNKLIRFLADKPDKADVVVKAKEHHAPLAGPPPRVLC